MLAIFLGDREFQTAFDMVFTYRYNIRYQEGLSKKIPISPAFHQVRLFDHYDLYDDIDREVPPSFRKIVKGLVNLFLIKYLFLIMNLFTLYRHFSKFDIDLLHINNGGYPGAYSTISAVFAAKLAGVKRVVYVINNIPVGYRSPERWLDYPIDRVLIHFVTQFVTGSNFTREKAIQILNIPSDKIMFIHNGIVPHPVTEAKSQYLSRLGLPHKPFIISVIASLEERKGHIYLFKAIQVIRETHPGIGLPFCIIAGTGPLEEYLKQSVHEMDIASHVLFIGHEDHVFNLINASDCIVLPSIKNEDLPFVILEAMFSGKPIIASDLAGIPEEIGMNSGILIPPGDYKRLADEIMTLMADESLRKYLGKNAENRFRENFTHEKALKNYFALSMKLLGDEA